MSARPCRVDVRMCVCKPSTPPKPPRDQKPTVNYQVVYDDDGELKVWLGWSDECIVVCFRGSTTASNWIADAMVRVLGPGAYCHALHAALPHAHCACDPLLETFFLPWPPLRRPPCTPHHHINILHTAS